MSNSSSINVGIPKRSLWSALGLVVVVAFSWLQFIAYLGPGFREMFELRPEAVTMSSIGLMWVPIISYLLVATMVALAVNVFKPLKSITEKGLVRSLVGGLVGGLAVGLLLGPAVGLVWGLFVGLFWGLFVGLFWRLFDEFD